NLKEYSELNLSFHMKMYEVIPQEMLVDMIRNLWKKWVISKATFKLANSRVPSSCEEHEKIIALAEAKKYNAIELYVREHTQKSGRQFVNTLKKEHLLHNG